MKQVVVIVSKWYSFGVSLSSDNKDTCISVQHTLYMTTKKTSLIQRNLKPLDYQIFEYEIKYGIIHDIHVHCR